MNKNLINELEVITHKIENNSAFLEDYKRYEVLLTKGGLSHDKIFTYLNRAGFNNWTDFYNERNSKVKSKNIEAGIIGGLIGLGIGLIISALFDD